MLKQYAINLSFFFWQVVRALLALSNEHAVQIDSHDTLWGETGMFSSTFLHYETLRYYHSLFCFSIMDRTAVAAAVEGSCISLLHSNALCLM